MKIYFTYVKWGTIIFHFVPQKPRTLPGAKETCSPLRRKTLLRNLCFRLFLYAVRTRGSFRTPWP